MNSVASPTRSPRPKRRKTRWGENEGFLVEERDSYWYQIASSNTTNRLGSKAGWLALWQTA